ncbi:putative Glycosyl transferase [uncultured delta proteobacterium]|uniref:Putative Glycosyl transferase n=1 Tax=uncultured delta proteobacterium TaxID=34034 RepID=A0A212K9T2_9DELT|nr:putative Glycosyl transferase [uncultured delta proteobacterium]
MTGSPLLSVVIPVFNAAPLLDALHADICRSLEGLDSYELIFVDDGSGDGSAATLQRIARKDPAARVLALPRNTGQQEATLTGLALAAGEYCATMDDDGQHPPGLLPGMLARLRADGLDILYAVPEGRRESLMRTVGGIMRDGLFTLLFPHCGRDVRVSSYRVMTRALALRVLAGRSSFNYFSAMVFQEPTRAAVIPYPFRPCRTGRSGYSFGKLLALYWKIFRHYGPFGTGRPPLKESPAAREVRGFD